MQHADAEHQGDHGVVAALRSIVRGAWSIALLCAVLSLAVSCGRASTSRLATLRIAAAANLRYALPEIIAAFEQEHAGVRVEAVYGSSGNFFSQIDSGAPFDVFLSADEGYPATLAGAGRADAATLRRYACGRLALWAPLSSPVDVSLGYAVLDDGQVKRVAIANPQHAPYGVAAEQALKTAGALERLRDRLVLGDNVAQAAQFVQSGSAQVGIVALSLVLGPEMKDTGRVWIVPAADHAPIIQSGVVTTRSQHKKDALAFLDSFGSPGVRAILQRYGFDPPPGD